MKLLTILFVVFFLVSCSSDDSNNGSDPIVIEGLYTLTAANTTPFTDLNGDGTDSMNQIEETSCYNDMQIAFNGFGDFTAVFKKVTIGTSTDINTGEESLVEDCQTILAEGTYVLNGTQLTLNYSVNGSQVTDVYTASSQTLQRTLNNQQLVDSTEDGSYEYITGDLSLVFFNN